MARVAGGIAGWLIGLLPLIAVNIAGKIGTLSADDAVLAGAVALLGGLLLGGIVAGAVGGRPARTRPGGVTGAFISGGIAALLYAVALIALVIGAGRAGAAPAVVAEHPIRMSAAVVFLAALLLAIAVVTGAIAGRGHQGAAAHQDAPPLPRYGNVFERDEQPARRTDYRTRPLDDYRERPPRHAPPTQPRYREGQPVRPPAPTRPGVGQWQQRDYPPQDEWRR